MKNRPEQIVLAVMTIVLAGAAEELLPKVWGVGLPLLLAATAHVARRGSLGFTVLFALAAGAVEEGLSSLPLMTCASFFLATALVVRQAAVSAWLTPLAYVACELWLCAWLPTLSGGVFGRVLLAIPLGLAAVCAVEAVLTFVERKAAVDEAE